MMDCKSGQCGMGSSYDEAAAGDGCACNAQGCSCGCSCGSGCTCGCNGKAEELFALARSAHHELLKQKMKAVFETKIGKKMDKVAELVVETALVYMQDKMAEKQAQEKFEEKLMNIFRS